MTTQEVSVARFSGLAPNEALFVDTVLPGYARKVWSIIGANVGEDRSVTPPIAADGFNLAIVEAEPGNGSALHDHTTVEVFVPLSGRWEILTGPDGGEVTLLEPWDVCSVPPGVWRGFRNAGDTTAHLLVVVGGTDAGRLTWAPEVLAAAGKQGATLDAAGFRVEPDVVTDPFAHLPGAGRASVLVEGLDHPEGVAWDPLSGTVVAGGELGQIYRVALDDPRPTQVAQAPDFVLGVTVDGRGRVVACVIGDHPSVCVVEGDTVSAVVTHVEGEPLLFPNSPAFGPDGTLYFTDSGGWHANRGRVIRVTPDGIATVVSRELDRFPNGCAVTPDGGWLWVAESQGPGISRFDLEAGTRPELLLELHGHVPDGLAFTADGGCLISNYRPDRVYHLDRNGRLEVVAQDPHGTLLAAPTNVCFVGERLDRVVSANLGRWHLTLLDLGLVGAPLHYPERWAADVTSLY